MLHLIERLYHKFDKLQAVFYFKNVDTFQKIELKCEGKGGYDNSEA